MQKVSENFFEIDPKNFEVIIFYNCSEKNRNKYKEVFFELTTKQLESVEEISEFIRNF